MSNSLAGLPWRNPVVSSYQHHHYTIARIVGQSTLWTFFNFFLRPKTKKRNSKNHAKNNGGGNFHHKRLAVWFLCRFSWSTPKALKKPGQNLKRSPGKQSKAKHPAKILRFSCGFLIGPAVASTPLAVYVYVTIQNYRKSMSTHEAGYSLIT